MTPSRQGVLRRCPACVDAGRYRCARCDEVFTEVRTGRGSKPLCETCRKGEVGPRGGRPARPVLRPRRERIRYVCRGVVIGRGHPQHAEHCAGSCTLTAAQLKYRVAKAQAPGARWGSSLDSQTRTYICRACSGLRRVVDMARAACRNCTLPDDVLDELDHMGFIHRPPTTLADAKRVNRLVAPYLGGTLKPPEAINAAKRLERRRGKAKQRADRAARGVRSPETDKLREERRGDRIAAGKWRRGVGIRVSSCLWPKCGLLVFSHTSLTREPELHQACMTAAMRSPEGRKWLGERKEERDAGVPSRLVNRHHGMHLPIAGRPDADRLTERSDVLTKQLTWAVRHLLGDEPQQALGREYGVTRQAVAQGIDRVLGLLPTDALVPAYYRPLVNRLRRADQRRQGG